MDPKAALENLQKVAEAYKGNYHDHCMLQKSIITMTEALKRLEHLEGIVNKPETPKKK